MSQKCFHITLKQILRCFSLLVFSGQIKKVFPSRLQLAGSVMIWNDEQQKRMLVTHSVCAGACRRRSSPGAAPAMGKANGWEANPTQRKRQKTKKLTQAQKAHTLAWCYCVISQHRQLKHHACVLKKDPTHEVDSVAAHNHQGSQYRRDSTQSSRFNTLFEKLLEKRSSGFLWSALIRVLSWTPTTITAGGLSRRPPQRLHFQSEKTWGTENGNHSERAQQLY